jgi:hypothetical protein
MMALARGMVKVSCFSSACSRVVQLSARPVFWLPDRRSFPPSQASSPVALGKELPGHSGGPAPDSHHLPDSPHRPDPCDGTRSVGTPCDVAPRLADGRRLADVRQLGPAAMRVPQHRCAEPFISALVID